MIRTVLQVGDKFCCTFKIDLQEFLFLIFQTPEDHVLWKWYHDLWRWYHDLWRWYHNLWIWQHRCMIRLANSSTAHFHADIHTLRWRLHILMSMNDNLFAPQHRRRRMGSNLFLRKWNDGLKKIAIPWQRSSIWSSRCWDLQSSKQEIKLISEVI